MFSLRRAFLNAFSGSPIGTKNVLAVGQHLTFLPRLQPFSARAVGDSYDEDDDEDEDTEEDVSTVARGELPKIKERLVDDQGRAYGTGRRKTSVARVWIREGCGEITVNDKKFSDAFAVSPRQHIMEAFLVSKTSGFFDVFCTAKGGGQMGQAGAVRLGVARALEAYDPMLRPVLRSAGLLTRDARRVERKKPGQKKARKKFQWVKR